MTMEQEYNADRCCEPATAPAVATDEWENLEEPEIPYEVDFGYPRTIDELKAEVERAVSERNDPSKWISHDAFMHRLEQRFPWL